ncbi:FxsB family cyclophane-forming radical SAM/SPASM peptide maturase [Streptomyces sp. B6B3]|uniref:FxsB family cyclophane-forming radical SAM/SPASM peptide maturase n=1 Tax=Streptomyces sp. B6B3 TaxID=3153570 RepID=UPI00325D7A1A
MTEAVRRVSTRRHRGRAPHGPAVAAQAPTFDSATAPAEPWRPHGTAAGGDDRRPRPFDQFIVKLHGRCDLACDYCYVYELRDTGWRDRPRAMAPATLDRLAARIAEHAGTHRLAAARIVLHGGEPLLAGSDTVARFAATATRRLRRVRARPDIVLQTNGVRLTTDVLDTLLRHGVRVGVSLDGDRVGHDRHRRRADGRGSHAEVTRALRLLNHPDYRGLFEGLLCTVDLRNDPVATYRALAAHRPPMLDFALPHATWEHPPPAAAPGAAPYGAWLVAAFDDWWAAARPPRVRLFDSLVDLWRGGTGGSEVVGLATASAVTVETDGSIALADWLKAVANGAGRTGLDIHRHAFDEALAIRERTTTPDGLAGLCGTCRACPVARVCGGGLRAHRFSPERDYANPSVYCRDLAALIGHVAERLAGAAGTGSPGTPGHRVVNQVRMAAE